MKTLWSVLAVMMLAVSAFAAPVVTFTRGNYNIASITVDSREVADPHDLWCGYDVLQNTGARVSGINLYNSAVALTATPSGSTLTTTNTMTRPGGYLVTAAMYTPIAGGLRISVTKRNLAAESVTVFVDVLQDLKIAWPTNYNKENVRPDVRGFPVLWLNGCLSTPVIVACEDIQPAVQVFFTANNLGNPSLRINAARGWLGLRSGETLTYTVGVYFDPDCTAAQATYARIHAARPPTPLTSDRSPIIAVHVAGGLGGDTPEEKAYRISINPWGYLPGNTRLDLMSVGREARFETALNAFVDLNIQAAKTCGAKEIIVWDADSAEGLPGCKYIGDPRQMPPWTKPIFARAFERIKTAGIKVGFCLRPIVVGREIYNEAGMYGEPNHPNDATRAISDPESSFEDDIIRKVQYVQATYGADTCYVDSDGLMSDVGYGVIHKACSTMTLLSEHNRSWAHTAAYDELRLGVTSHPSLWSRIYPGSFTVIQIDGYDEAKHLVPLTAAVKARNVRLMGTLWSATAIKKIYDAAAQN